MSTVSDPQGPAQSRASGRSRMWTNASSDRAVASRESGGGTDAAPLARVMRRTRYIKKEKIGQGTYGVVYKGISISPDGEERDVALKKVRLEDDGNGVPWNAIREVASLKHLQHPKIVTMLDLVIDQNVMWLAFEYLKEDLWAMIKNKGGGLEYDVCKSILFQLLSAVDFCHRQQILHRDVKPGNVLLDEFGGIKLADFGMARPIRNGFEPYSPQVVTLWYRAPELLFEEHYYSTAIDVWSVGCVFIEMVNGEPVFQGDSDVDQLHRIFQVLGTPNEDTWPGFSKYEESMKKLPCYQPVDIVNVVPKMCEGGRDLCMSMLEMFPDRRISASQALQHPLMQHFEPIN
eukprot:m.167092 g.167092  ORF g.167092 m.167092 type:complete len:346 (+) comp12777_c0_seq1:171-1208(+)